MDSDKKRFSSFFVALVVVAIVGTFLFLAFYKTDSTMSIATSPYSAEEIKVAMSATEHIRFIEELGITPSGKTLFSYQWVDYGIFDAFRCFGEDDEVSEALDIVDVKR